MTDADRSAHDRQRRRVLAKTVAVGGAKATWWAGKVAVKGTRALTRNGSKATSAAARRALGGTRYRRSADDVNNRIADALATLDALLRARDAEIARLEAELAAERSRRR